MYAALCGLSINNLDLLSGISITHPPTQLHFFIVLFSSRYFSLLLTFKNSFLCYKYYFNQNSLLVTGCVPPKDWPDEVSWAIEEDRLLISCNQSYDSIVVICLNNGSWQHYDWPNCTREAAVHGEAKNNQSSSFRAV